MLDDVLRLAAAADRPVHRVFDISAARAGWQKAPLIFLDEAALSFCLSAEFVKRSGIYVLTAVTPSAELLNQALSIGAEQVFQLPMEEATVISIFRDNRKAQVPTNGHVIAVLGARGGAGASVFAAATAMVSAKNGQPTLLVDCDPLSGGIDLVLGIERQPGSRWSGITVTTGRLADDALWKALPTVSRDLLAVLSCDQDTVELDITAMAAVLAAGRRCGTVICDLPRALGNAVLPILDHADLAVLVVPAEVRACAAAIRVAKFIQTRGTRTGLVVRGPAPTGLTASDVAEAVRLPVLASMRPHCGLDAALDLGGVPYRRRSPLIRAAQQVLAKLT